MDVWPYGTKSYGVVAERPPVRFRLVPVAATNSALFKIVPPVTVRLVADALCRLLWPVTFRLPMVAEAIVVVAKVEVPEVA